MRRTGLAAVFALLCLTALTACNVSVGFSTRTFGAASVQDLQAEFNYNSVYAQQIARIHADLEAFLPAGSNPGVCNRGGSAPGCIAADTTTIGDLQTMIAALQAIPVPPRFVEPDRLLRAALAQQAQGLTLRDQALANNDDALWQQHITVLAAATTAIQQAYQAFPADNRPAPAP